MQFTPLRLFRLSARGRVFGIGGCASDLVVTVADKAVGFQDTLTTFAGGRFSTIEGLADPAGALPTLAPDCRMLFNRIDHSTDPPTDRRLVWDPQSRITSELHSATLSDKELGVPDWGPNGQVAVFEGTSGKPGVPAVTTSIVVISSDGSRRIPL